MKKRAFTLIEMMIAIFIISMLLVMAVPKYNRVMLKSRTEEAKSIIQSIIFAQERYKQERGTFYVDGTNTITDENLIETSLKINLSKSNNFDYSIKGDSNGNFTIKAVLSSYIKNVTDDWVNQYKGEENKHFLEFRYPNKLTGDFVEGGISYENLYD